MKINGLLFRISITISLMFDVIGLGLALSLDQPNFMFLTMIGLVLPVIALVWTV